MPACTAFLAHMAAIQALRAFFSWGSGKVRADALAYRAAPFELSLRRATEPLLCVTDFDI